MRVRLLRKSISKTLTALWILLSIGAPFAALGQGIFEGGTSGNPYSYDSSQGGTGIFGNQADPDSGNFTNYSSSSGQGLFGSSGSGYGNTYSNNASSTSSGFFGESDAGLYNYFTNNASSTPNGFFGEADPYNNPYTNTPATGSIGNPVGSCPKNFDTLTEIMDYVACSIAISIIPVLIALALLVFFYGVVRYVIAGDGSDDREEGRWFMIYGVIGLFVMVAIWGLVAVVANTFQIDTNFPPQFPSTQ